MPAQNHENAAKSHRKAADHHDQAAKHYTAGDRAKGDESAKAAKASAHEGIEHAERAPAKQPAASK